MVLAPVDGSGEDGGHSLLNIDGGPQASLKRVCVVGVRHIGKDCGTLCWVFLQRSPVPARERGREEAQARRRHLGLPLPGCGRRALHTTSSITEGSLLLVWGTSVLSGHLLFL